ncbi:MAG: AAA family ATPase, partial [Desulfonatronovibrio sp. MSAO_Bac4]
IDSLSHAWSGQGGILEFVDRASQVQRNNFAAWREASPKHNSLVDAILGSDLHIIVTMRSKTAWEVQKDEKTGKTRPVKIGLAPVQRDGLEYEFTCVLELSVDGHIATASKDRTGLFDGRYVTPDIETGQILKEWLQGKGEKPTDLINDIMAHLFKLGLGSKLSEYEAYIESKYGRDLKGLTYSQLKEQIKNLELCHKDQDLQKRFIAFLIKQAA